MTNWISPLNNLPSKGQKVLATVEDMKSRQRAVISCDYDWRVDTVTGEILGDTTFMQFKNDTVQDTSVNLDDGVEFKVIAWMPYPEPYDRFAVIVAGSRTFNDYPKLATTLDKAFSKRKPTSILCGEAKGADKLGRRYGERNGIRVDSYPADWLLHGKGAGYIRNEQMAADADALIAFWNGTSAGTKHMIDTARKKGLQVRVINFKGA